MRSDVVQAALRHAEREAPRESCGLVVEIDGREIYMPCHNVSPTPEETFSIAPEEYAEVEDKGRVTTICHSHVKRGVHPSAVDRAMCEKSGLPWLIVAPHSGDSRITKPEGFKAPLIGREFSYGVFDCCVLVEDYYLETLDIKLPAYEHPVIWPRRTDPDLIHRNLDFCGFAPVPLTDMKVHDVLTMSLNAKFATHLAIYVGDNMILQHMERQLSSRDVYGSYWRHRTLACYRHFSQMKQEDAA